MEKINTAVDFRMTDRSGDCGKFFKGVCLAEKKALKCCAHTVLMIDYATDEVF